MTTDQYFTLPSSLQRMELEYGMVREPPAPSFGHQSLVTRLGALLYLHVSERGLGAVCVAPIDVVLDREAALVVQPDIVFVATDRLHIVRNRVWGAPDLVVEVLSPGTTRGDRTTKLDWYRRYGVAECWYVDANARHVDVIFLKSHPEVSTRFSGDACMSSGVLPHWSLTTAQVFD